jgi:hypothetical protein
MLLLSQQPGLAALVKVNHLATSLQGKSCESCGVVQTFYAFSRGWAVARYLAADERG